MKFVKHKTAKEKKLYAKPVLSTYDSLHCITLHGSCLCSTAATDSCPGDDNGCDRGFTGTDYTTGFPTGGFPF